MSWIGPFSMRVVPGDMGHYWTLVAFIARETALRMQGICLPTMEWRTLFSRYRPRRRMRSAPPCPDKTKVQYRWVPTAFIFGRSGLLGFPEQE